MHFLNKKEVVEYILGLLYCLFPKHVKCTFPLTCNVLFFFLSKLITATLYVSGKNGGMSQCP